MGPLTAHSPPRFTGQPLPLAHQSFLHPLKYSSLHILSQLVA